eukprot:s373_g21.t1
MDVLWLGGTYDQLNLPVSYFETVAWRIQCIVDAYALGGSAAPDWGNAKLFTGYMGPADLVMPHLKTWAARRARKKWNCIKLFTPRSRNLTSLVEVRKGRWKSHTCVPRYEKSAHLAANFQALSPALQHHCLLAEQQLGDVMLGRVPAQDRLQGQRSEGAICRRPFCWVGRRATQAKIGEPTLPSKRCKPKIKIGEPTLHPPRKTQFSRVNPPIQAPQAKIGEPTLQSKPHKPKIAEPTLQSQPRKPNFGKPTVQSQPKASSPIQALRKIRELSQTPQA